MLCKENIAWCSTKTLEELEDCGQMIECGYLVQPPKRKIKYLLKVRKEEEDLLARGEIPKVTFREDDEMTAPTKEKEEDAVPFIAGKSTGLETKEPNIELHKKKKSR